MTALMIVTTNTTMMSTTTMMIKIMIFDGEVAGQCFSFTGS